jgi:hypothetical protein
MYIIKDDKGGIIHLSSTFKDAMFVIGCYLNNDKSGIIYNTFRVKLDIIFFKIFGRLHSNKYLWIYKHTLGLVDNCRIKYARIITIGEDYILTDWSMNEKEIKMLWEVI